ncbi:GGDEF domain-containing protein [Paraglaciecola arctica]|uniref:GGDEF domain-containing protein n=1 Tax=Paraglaciecola arctica TaxID=1128911 RepID=UPI001C065ECD|nr:GGDEF domain-containing protein [Paraglaciecola arctica]MBU3003388.1 GGDEF domain-containing protein [Paraglaciecola arctica]
MRKLIEYLGLTTSIIIITLISVIASLVITWGVNYFAAVDVSYLAAIVAPILIAPLITWHITRLVIEISSLERTMRDLATYDSLTGLLNRNAFLYDCKRIIKFARDENYVSLIALDLDKFKLINDTFGHAGGDAVLQDFGKIIQGSIRKGDLAGRIGGEEFLIFLGGLSNDGALALATRLLTTTRNSTVAFESNTINYTVSIGICSMTLKDEEEFAGMMKKADTALYSAKSQGRDCIFSL